MASTKQQALFSVGNTTTNKTEIPTYKEIALMGIGHTVYQMTSISGFKSYLLVTSNILAIGRLDAEGSNSPSAPYHRSTHLYCSRIKY